jgi:hypothetical protein
MTARVFLGVFEAGFGPVIPLYLCMFTLSFVILAFLLNSSIAFWYTKQELGLRVRLVRFDYTYISNIYCSRWRIGSASLR